MNAADFPHVRLAEALEILASMPGFLQGAIDAEPGQLTFKPAPEEFSLVEQACHLRDLEREGYLVRVRRMLTEDLPALEGFDGAAVAAARDYLVQDARDAVADFAAARGQLVAMLTVLTPADLAREGEFAGKRICMADLVSMIAEHDRGHREEIARLLAALED